MPSPLLPADLEAYLDEALPPEEMSRIEDALRRDPKLVRELAAVNARRDAGVHTLGEIWRRHRLTCPPRDRLGSYLLGILPDGEAEYITFHLETLGCRYCRANADDLRNQQSEAAAHAASRRKKYFQSSAGYLRKQ
ncbi:MAG: hypothetical protein HY000_22050 [Planctomycetes bacterium]|nr:hypothetical protein [Planctomycetota bacterium]